uniref:Uncharacterized protein n=1 Tax=Arundo donax TaxID=35708 RepID=A0A0A9H9S6_ARUDO
MSEQLRDSLRCIERAISQFRPIKPPSPSGDSSKERWR